MKKTYFLTVFLLLGSSLLFAQVAVNTDGSVADPSAILDAKSNNKGFLPPRMNTSNRNAIASPAAGLIIYNTDCNDIQVYNGMVWVPVGNSGLVAAPGSVTGPAIVCPDATGVVYTCSTVSGASGFNWVVPYGAVITGGQGSDAITVSFGVSGGNICVNAFNTCWKSPVHCLDIMVGSPGSPEQGIHISAKSSITWNWEPVTGASGYKWNTLNDYVTATDIGTGLTHTEMNLSCGSTYNRYLWAYNQCSNSAVTTITQSTLSCTDCGSAITDARNGKIYNTIAIGNQCWLKENLDIGTQIDGSIEQTNNQVIEKYCYDNNEANCAIYGGLYQWGELVQYLNGASDSTTWSPPPSGNVQGICPAGWHIPDNTEWCVLSQYLDPTVNCGATGQTGTDISYKLREAGTAHWAAPNTGATNSSGFTALPAGMRYESTNFYSLTYNTTYWSATTTYYLSSHYRRLTGNAGTIENSWNPKTSGYSARCLRDE